VPSQSGQSFFAMIRNYSSIVSPFERCREGKNSKPNGRWIRSSASSAMADWRLFAV